MKSTQLLKKIFEVAVVAAILYSIYLLILLSLPYIYFKPGVEFLETKQLIYHIDWWRWSFYVHVFASPIVITTGLLQFSKKLLYKFPGLHRKIGKTYVFFVLLVSGPSGLIMSFYANGGYIAQVSFVLLSSLWILFTYIGFQYAKKRKFEKHTLWMFRSYALTLSAVTLRFYAYLFDVFNIPLSPSDSYILLSYLSWIPNLLIIEVLRISGYLKSFSVKKRFN